MDCFCDYDAPEFYHKHIRRARKLKRCHECGCDIRQGDEHEVVSGKWDGQVSSFFTCERCLSFRKWFAANRPCFCWAHASMLEDARNQIEAEAHPLRKEAPGFLFEAGRRAVAIRRRAHADRAARIAAKNAD